MGNYKVLKIKFLIVLILSVVYAILDLSDVVDEQTQNIVLETIFRIIGVIIGAAGINAV